MKTKIAKRVIWVLFLIPIISYSQIRFGVKGSVHRTNVSEIHSDSEGRIAGALGGVAQIQIGRDNQFYFQPEVVYSLQGEIDQTPNGDVKYFQNYINIPLMFRAYFSEDDSEFFGEIGPQIGFLVNEKNKDKDREIYDKPNSIDFSIGLGIGYSFLRRYEISFRYNYGLIDAYKDYYGQQRTSAIGLAFTYMFD